MAAPADVTIKDLNGQFTMDKTLSNDTDPLLGLQGMGWMLRKTLSYASITLYVKQYADTTTPTVSHVDIDQRLTGGIQGTTENRVTDWEKRIHEDHVFGRVEGQSRFLGGTAAGADGKVRPALEMQTSVDDNEKVEKFLKGETLVDGSPAEGFLDEGEWLQSFVRNLDNGWTAEQVWGFEMVDGKRYYTRRVVVAKDGAVEMARFVYTFLGRGEQTE